MISEIDWQPIETAPLSGVFITASPKNDGTWHVNISYTAINGTIRSETGAYELKEATHWIPLPPPPSNTK